MLLGTFKSPSRSFGICAEKYNGGHNCGSCGVFNVTFSVVGFAIKSIVKSVTDGLNP